MCLAVLALAQHPRFPVVLAANRDEFFDRPASPLDWWQPTPAAPFMLSGRDLSAGGTWFGLSREGRLALLTNVRDPANVRADAPSRGRIVLDWLSSQHSLAEAGRTWQGIGFNGFNLIAADLSQNQWGWTGSNAETPVGLSPGLHGLSNASLDTPWPKVLRLRERVQSHLRDDLALVPLVERLFDALTDSQRAPDPTLPQTGLPLEVERALSSVFIRTDDGRYGTRCSTVLVGEHDPARGLRLHVFERTFADPDGDGELACTVVPLAAEAPLAPIQRVAHRGLGYGTTLSSAFTNSAAD